MPGEHLAEGILTSRSALEASASRSPLSADLKGSMELLADRDPEEARAHGVPLQIRVGLNSGEVVVRAIDTPARRGLRAGRGPAAGPGQGPADPVEVYALTGASAQRTRLHAAAARGLTRFIGRDAEIEQIRRALALAHAGHGQLVAVVGEPGVGKSRQSALAALA